MAVGAKIANRILNFDKVKYLTKPNAAGAAATIALASNLSKDGVNCYYYVTQSLGNEKIPEEKRKFVAALDLSNGILNIITQLAIGIPLPKLMNKLFDKKVAPKYFSKEAAKKVYDEMGQKIPFDKFFEKFAKNKSYAKVGLSVIATLVGTQVIAKRVIVPFIATPMASFFKKRFENGSKTPKATTPEAQQPGVSVAPSTSDSDVKNVNNLPECFKPFN